MSMKNMRKGAPNLFKQGTKVMSGTKDVVLKNIEACKDLATITRTSYGPNGMHKMVINRHDKVFVTSDAATIMAELEVEHPAAKLLCLASEMQQQEIGDGSNAVLVLAGELLNQAEALIQKGLHTVDIVKGFEVALKHALSLMDSLVIYSEKDFHSEDRLASAVISSISAKQHGYEGILAPLVAKACAATMPKKPQNFVVENVRVCKIHGGSVSQSEVVSGIVLDRDVEGQVKSKTGAKIAIFNESVDSIDTETKGTVRLNGAQDLLNYNESEEKHIETVITNLKNLGVDVVVSGGKFGEMALHYIEKFGMMAVRVMSKHELRRLAQAVRGRMVVTLGTTTLEDLGYADEVFVRELGLQKVTIFNRSKEETAISTIILRSSTQNLLNDFERAVEDGINVIRAMTRDPRFVAGAGAFEIELARIISAFGEKCSGLEQYAVKKFGEALEAFPRTLAENAGLDATDIVSKLYAAHERGETRVGVDIDSSEVSDMTSQGIYDLLCSKIQAMKLAVNAVNTVLRVDQIIMAKPAGGPRMPNRSGNWDDDD